VKQGGELDVKRSIGEEADKVRYDVHPRHTPRCILIPVMCAQWGINDDHLSNMLSEGRGYQNCEAYSAEMNRAMDICGAFFRNQNIKSEDFFSFADGQTLLYTINIKQYLQVSSSGRIVST
jgi:hypothetical protein